MKTCSGQEMTWWSDKCNECGHMLAVHRDATVAVEGLPDAVVEFGDCSMCTMSNEIHSALDTMVATLSESIAAQNTALRSYADDMQEQAQNSVSLIFRAGW